VAKKKLIYLDFEIDKITNSIENSLTGETFLTEIIKVLNKDTGQIKKTDWQFDWIGELKNNDREIYKLNTINNSNVIQGLISLKDNNDHIFIHLIENAKINRGKNKLYKGVAGNLVAFACRISFEKGYDGVVAFVAKSKLVKHYELTLGAKQFSGNRMFIDTAEALILVKEYFK